MPEQVTIDGNTYEYKNGTLLLKSGLLKNSSSNPISVKKVIFPNAIQHHIWIALSLCKEII